MTHHADPRCFPDQLNLTTECIFVPTSRAVRTVTRAKSSSWKIWGLHVTSKVLTRSRELTCRVIYPLQSSFSTLPNVAIKVAEVKPSSTVNFTHSKRTAEQCFLPKVFSFTFSFYRRDSVKSERFWQRHVETNSLVREDIVFLGASTNPRHTKP